MEHFQTESRSNYENNKRHHTVDMGKENLDSSKSDEEYASCGFYVREKNEKCADSPETDIHNEDNFQNDTHDHNELQENEDTEIKSSKENVKYIKESELNDTNVKPLFSSSNKGEGENELNSMESNNTPKTIETTQLDRINKIVTPHSVDKSPTVLESLETDKCLNSQESDESNVLECLNSEKFDYGKPKSNDLDKDSNSYLNVPNELKLSGSDNNTTKSFKGTQISHPTEAENKEHESENKPDSDDIKKVECQSGITKQEENETEKKSILKTIASEEISEDKDPTVTTENEKNENDDNGNPDSREPKDDEDMDYDFDPSLLCPDISMDVDEAPVITNSDNVPNDGNVSPLPYEQSFSTYVDEMTGAEISFDLTLEEEALRGRLFGHANPIQFSKIHCTACNVHLGSALDGQKNRFVHPLLKVLICKNCYHFYTSGEFEKDEDGSELYCRWCGQGGQVLCCSSCEFVFCKRCIKNNFGMKKFKEIRDSDDWNCFRCDPGQLSILRASCAEFIDYVRGETAKVTLVDDVPLFMATDHTTCCNQPAKKKEVDKDKITQTQKRKRKNSSDDPDFKLEEESDPKKAIVQQPATIPIVSATPGVVLVPRSIVAAPNSVGIVQVKQRPTMSTFRVGQASFRPKGQTVGYTITRPQQQVSTPGFIKIMSPHIVTRSPTSASGSTFSTIRARPQANTQQPQIKHEWFEKTVRAAARVNSNLSYTLTQLNRQQSTASSVEALALIHNKLQEVLSTSINSLIQIRKNLRTEFIAGIKNIKFPPKSVLVKQTQPITVKDDDDVIFVNPTAASSEASPLISLSSAVTLSSVKKAPITSESPYTNPTPSTSYTTVADTSVRKGGYLKVKSFSALQNVSSECITIPDDPPLPPPPNLTPINKLKRLLSQNDDENTDVNSTQESKTNEINNHDDDVVEIIEDQIETIVNDSDEDNSDQNNKGIEDSLNVIDINKIISSDLKLKHGTFIYLERSREIDEILNSQIINGDQ